MLNYDAYLRPSTGENGTVFVEGTLKGRAEWVLDLFRQQGIADG
jgi:hypothetical protein